MIRSMMAGKIHRATVTQANVDYEGSITIDPDLMDAAGILQYELVQVLDITNGARLETYAIEGTRGSGEVCVNGAAGLLVRDRDLVIILHFLQFVLTPQQYHHFKFQKNPVQCRIHNFVELLEHRL